MVLLKCNIVRLCQDFDGSKILYSSFRSLKQSKGGKMPIDGWSVQWIRQGREARVRVDNAEITEEKPLCFRLRVKKLPLPTFPIGEVFDLQTVRVSFEEPLLGLMKKAEKLSLLTEKERIAPLIDLARQSFVYPMPELVRELEKTKPEIAQWIKENFEGYPSKILLSEFIRYGYGVCRHYSALFLVLAQAAGLKGIVAACPKNTLFNFIRSDTNEALFRIPPLGRVEYDHSWNEVSLET
jgi:hypothetical protein